MDINTEKANTSDETTLKEKVCSMDSIKDMTEEITGNISQLIQTARDAAHDKVLELERAGGIQSRALKTKVRKHPLEAILIASGLGLILGWLFSKR